MPSSWRATPRTMSKKKVWQPLGFGDKGLSEALKRLKVEGTRPDCRCLRSGCHSRDVSTAAPRATGVPCPWCFFPAALSLVLCAFQCPLCPRPPPPSSQLLLSTPLICASPTPALCSPSHPLTPHPWSGLIEVTLQPRTEASTSHYNTATQYHGCHGRLDYKRRPATVRNPHFCAQVATQPVSTTSTVPYRVQYAIPLPADVIAASATGDSKIACISPRQGIVERGCYHISAAAQHIASYRIA